MNYLDMGQARPDMTNARVAAAHRRPGNESTVTPRGAGTNPAVRETGGRPGVPTMSAGPATTRR